MSLSPARSLWLGLAISPWLVSCGTLQPYAPKNVAKATELLQQTGLTNAERMLLEAKRLKRYSEVATVYRLRAGELAWSELASVSGSSTREQAIRVVNQAQEGLAEELIHDEDHTETFTYAGLTYEVTVPATPGPGGHRASEFSKVHAAAEAPLKLCQKRITEPGVGLPLAAHWKVPSQPVGIDRFVGHRGFLLPITSVLQYPGKKVTTRPRQVTISLLDPTAVSSVQIGSSKHPLAADFTGPIEDVARGVKEASVALMGVFKPHSQDCELNLLDPYDPKRIPVVFVHGLNSHPRMWRDVYNELRADPELRGKYQFWSYRYPTGWPMTYSAMRLREEMAAFDKLMGHQSRIVMIGHSMGGLVSRLQMISPEREIWDANLKERANELYRELPSDHLKKKMMLFSRNEDIGRAIFVCVPHRGSKIADWSIIAFVAKLVKLPADIIAATADLSQLALGGQVKPVNGVNRLAPGNPTFAAMDRVKIPVPYHSIIGDRGKGDSPKSSDGAVEYWSSHQDGAASELIVPDNHGAYDNPLAIQEMKRILKLHLKQ